jgi:hypothetical protein
VRDRIFGHTDHTADEGRRGRKKSESITYYAHHDSLRERQERIVHPDRRRDELDAGALLMPMVKFLSPAGPRF